MKTFQQYNETFNIPLKTTSQKHSGDHETINFMHGNVKYVINVEKLDRTVWIDYGYYDAEGFTEVSPTKKNSGQFQILATVLDVVRQWLDKPGVSRVTFIGHETVAKMYTAIAKKFKQYHVSHTATNMGYTKFSVSKPMTMAETMMIPLMHTVRTSEEDPNDKIYSFEYEGRSYRISLISHGRNSGGRRGSIAFSLIELDGTLQYKPTSHRTGTFQILSTVIKVLDDAFNVYGYDQISFNAVGKLVKLYDAMVTKLAGPKSEYNVEKLKSSGTIQYWVVTKK